MNVQLPASINGVLTGLLGGAGGLQGAEGLQGLFATLLGNANLGAKGLAPAGESAPLPNLTAALQDLETSLASLQGSAAGEDVKSLLQSLQATMETLQQAGVQPADIENTESLVAIFQKIGMPIAEAEKHAVNLEAAVEWIYAKQESGELASLLQSAPRNDLESTTALTQQPIDTLLAELTPIVIPNNQQVKTFAKVVEKSPVADVANRILLGKNLIPTLEEASGNVAVPITPIAGAGAVVEAVSEIVKPVAKPVETALKEILPNAKVAEAPIEIATKATEKMVEKIAMPEAVKPNLEAKILNVKASPESNISNLKVESHLPVNSVVLEQGYQAKRKSQPVREPAPIQGKELFKWDVTKFGVDILTENKANLEFAKASSAALESASMEGSGDAKAKAGAQSTFAQRMNQFARAAHVGTQAAPMLKALAQEGGGKISFTLNPRELGRVEISLEIKEGRVSGVIAAQNAEVISQLARELQHLKQGLADAGFELGEEGMAFLLQEDSGGSQHEKQEENSYAGAETENNEDAEIAKETNSENWVNPEQLLNITV